MPFFCRSRATQPVFFASDRRFAASCRQVMEENSRISCSLNVAHIGDQAKAMVAKHACAQNAGQSSSSPHNVVQEEPLFSLEDQGKAMPMEDMREQNITHNSSISLNVVHGEPPNLLRSGNDDGHIQELPVVTNESITTMDLDGVGRQPNTVEPMTEPDMAPTVGAFCVQCAKCMKWRFIPTKEQYEVIRQSILEKPFFCSSAATWRPSASCSDPLEISPDLHELWAVDRPSIPLPPSGWERLLVIRPQGSSKFADIYYVTPSGRKLRSMPEIVRYLEEHPEYVHAGLKLSQFSFLIPKPLDKDYSKKKNESLPCDQRGISSHKKSHSKNFVVESYLKKIGVMQNSFKGTSSKPKLEKLKCRKKAITPDGESQVFQVQDRIVDCKQEIETSLPSKELEKKTVWNRVSTSSGLGEIVNTCVTSTEQLPMSSRTEVHGAACHVK